MSSKDIFRSKLFLFLMMSLFCVFPNGKIHAQTGTATITGAIADQTRAAIPGARVTITNPLMKFTRDTITNKAGIYSFSSIPPAAYRVEVRAGNFKKAVKNNVQALVDSTVEANFSLEPGEITAVVNIKRESIESIVNRQDASLGNIFVPEQITQLPTVLRNVTTLTTLQPGVTSGRHVTGGRSDQANITLDGVDINDSQFGGSVLKVTVEAVDEFRITITNANANQGRSSGAQISMITRSGSNEWHGAGFYFYRPTKGSANSFFNNALGRYEADDKPVIDGLAEVGDERVPRPSLSRDVFGGRLGGPVIKDRAFFFYSYEGQYQDNEFPVLQTVPLAHLGQGALKFIGWLPGEDPNIVPAHEVTLDQSTLNGIYDQVGINPRVVALLADAAGKYPANDLSFGDGLNTGGFRFNQPWENKINIHTARFDLNLSDSQQLFVRGNYEWGNGSQIPQFPDTPIGSFGLIRPVGQSDITGRSTANGSIISAGV